MNSGEETIIHFATEIAYESKRSSPMKKNRKTPKDWHAIMNYNIYEKMLTNLHLTISDDFVSSNIYDKRDD